MMKHVLRAVAAGAVLAMSTAAFAQPKATPLTLDANGGFLHKRSGVGIPARIDTIKVSRATEHLADQLDIALVFDAPDKSEIISIYVYRPMAGALPIWFHQARLSIETLPAIYGTPAVIAATPVALPGQKNAAALLAAYRPDKGRLTGTGLLVAPVNSWLVKIRYSSTKVPAEAIPERLLAIAAKLDWPRDPAPAPAAALLAPCTGKLDFASTVNQVKPTSDAVVGDALMSIPESFLESDTAEAGESDPPVVWCIDERKMGGPAVYRPNGATDSYLLGLADSGKALVVAPAIVPDKKSKAWAIRSVFPDRTTNFLRHDGLPTPEQALSIAQAGRYGSTIDTAGESAGMTVVSDYMK